MKTPLPPAGPIPRCTPGAAVLPTANGWRLELPAGAGGVYRLAQLDDYARLPRRRLVHTPGLTLRLRARASAADLPGTWGFGLWNDPFGLSFGFGGTAARLPALPNAAWFFHASRENHLALREDLPACGLLAATFQSPRIPSLLLAPALPGALLLAIRPLARLARRLAKRVIRQDAARLELDVTVWHEYRLDWAADGVRFAVDGQAVLETEIVPRGRLGLVLWLDNQYAAFTAEGHLRWGTLPHPACWLELSDLSVQRLSVDEANG